MQLQQKVAELEKALQDSKAAADRSEQQKREREAETVGGAAVGSGEQPPKRSKCTKHVTFLLHLLVLHVALPPMALP
jgi:hypothetical protein